MLCVLPLTLVVFFWHGGICQACGVMRATSWIIPSLVCVSWLAYQINVAPLNAAQDKKIISILNDAAENGVRVISIAQKGFMKMASLINIQLSALQTFCSLGIVRFSKIGR